MFPLSSSLSNSYKSQTRSCASSPRPSVALNEIWVSFMRVDFCSEVRNSYSGETRMISKIPYNIAVRAGSGEQTVEDSDIEFIAARRAADGEP